MTTSIDVMTQALLVKVLTEEDKQKLIKEMRPLFIK